MNAPTTIAEVKRRNAAAGHYFFEASAMRFFNSKVETGVYGRGFFVTSETIDQDRPRDYTVRLARETGQVQTVGRFRQFGTLADAVDAARRCAGDTAPEVRFDAYEDRVDAGVTEANADPAHFHWRTFVGGLAVDVRNTRAKCELLVCELLGEPASECQNCGRVRPDSALLEARHLAQRVAPGEPHPSGECPDCHALCQPVGGDS